MRNVLKSVCIIILIVAAWSCQDRESSVPDPIIVEVDGGGNHILGDAFAPVRVIAFSDFECAYCKDFFTLIEGIKKDYIETGKVKYIYRDFPLEKHEQALASATCANCAGEQGKYWEMHKILFENQEVLNGQNYQKWAADLGLTMEAFNSCLESESIRNEIKMDYDKGEEIGIGGTPTFIINNEMYGGVPPENIFRELLDKAIQETTSN